MDLEVLLDTAERRGIISPEQAADLRSLSPSLRESDADDESLRFITGFGDAFVTIGLALFLGASAYFATQIAGHEIGGLIAVAIASWALAEYFTRIRRMALPSIVLLIAFALSTFGAVLLGLGGLPGSSQGGYVVLEMIAGLGRPALVAQSAFLTALLVGLHYWRFRVPVTVAAGAAGVALAALAALRAVAPGFVEPNLGLLVLALGLVVFGVAMAFDVSDTARVSRRTDIAFWLHLLAAPMIVHPVIAGIGSASIDGPRAAVILATFLMLGFVSVVIDRRALLVSGLSYAGYAFAALLQGGGLGDIALPATLLALGVFVLLLSAGWRPLRRAILGGLPGWMKRLLPGPAAERRIARQA